MALRSFQSVYGPADFCEGEPQAFFPTSIILSQLSVTAFITAARKPPDVVANGGSLKPSLPAAVRTGMHTAVNEGE